MRLFHKQGCSPLLGAYTNSNIRRLELLDELLPKQVTVLHPTNVSHACDMWHVTLSHCDMWQYPTLTWDMWDTLWCQHLCIYRKLWKCALDQDKGCRRHCYLFVDRSVNLIDSITLHLATNPRLMNSKSISLIQHQKLADTCSTQSNEVLSQSAIMLWL